jgi:hypothetical protein
MSTQHAKKGADTGFPGSKSASILEYNSPNSRHTKAFGIFYSSNFGLSERADENILINHPRGAIKFSKN